MMVTLMLAQHDDDHGLFSFRYDASFAQLRYRGYRHAPVQPQIFRGHIHHVQKGECVCVCVQVEFDEVSDVLTFDSCAVGADQ